MSARRAGEAGISLVEVLVVLAIVGLMTGLSVIGLGALDRGSRPEAEARRLADRLQLAADEALVTSAPMALVWEAQGYRFLGWDPAAGAWGPPALAELAAAHALPGAVRLAAADGGAETPPVLVTPDLAQPPVVLRLDGGGSAWRVAFDGFAAVAAPVAP